MDSSELISIGNCKEKGVGTLAQRKPLYIKTYGCQMNEYDSQKLARLLERDYYLVDRAEEAKLVLINTCSVRDKPQQKLYSLLGELSRFKAADREYMIGVGGCVAQQEGESITKRSKAVDFVFGTHNLSLVPSLIESRRAGAGQQVAIDYREDWEELPLGAPGISPGAKHDRSRVSAYVSISRGCNKNCTYCIVPTTRGKEVSRAEDEILREVRLAAHRGVKEIVLLGQTVNSYGRDLVPRKSFVDLLRSVSEIEGIERIRFTSPHPQEVRQDFIDLVCDTPKVCHHIHMPLQSGSDRILKAMNRNYRRAKYLSIIDALKQRVPDMAITTDIIVGFPGETERDFEETLEVMDLVEFYNSYSFVFSPRPGTPAASLEDSMPHSAKLERLQVLQARQTELTQRQLAAWYGKVVEVLLDGPSTSDSQCLQGRMPQNVVVNLVEPDAVLEPGMTVPVEIVEVSRHTLRGRRIEEGL